MSLGMAIWTLDDFWMLPFSRKKQANLIRQENKIPDDDWQKRHEQLSATHKHAEAHAQLIKGWKELIGQKSFREH